MVLFLSKMIFGIIYVTKTTNRLILNKMIIYNITVNIHESVHDAWMTWVNQNFIPEMIATGKFQKARMVKVLIEEEMGGTTYSLQFETPDKETLSRFYTDDFDRFENESKRLFGELMLTFKTELELISEH